MATTSVATGCDTGWTRMLILYTSWEQNLDSSAVRLSQYQNRTISCLFSEFKMKEYHSKNLFNLFLSVLSQTITF